MFSGFMRLYCILSLVLVFLSRIGQTAHSFTTLAGESNQQPTLLTAETLIFNFPIIGTVGTLQCDLQSVVPVITGFTCRALAAICSCYLAAGTYTHGSSYVLTVAARDSNDATDVATYNSLTVNIQNEAPQFVTMPRIVTQNVATGVPGLVIDTIAATDVDGDLLTWSLTSGTEFFSIHPGTGVISIIKDLKYATTPVIDVGISLSDSVNTPVTSYLRASLQNVNTIPRVLNWPMNKTVPESFSGGGTLCPITVEDPDNTPLSYDIQVYPTSTQSFFQYTQFPNGIILANTATLDYETVRYHEIRLTVSDRYASSQEYICRIYVTDDNDPPEFTKQEFQVTMDEHSFPVMDPLIASAWTDDDPSVQFYLQNVGQSGYFQIDRFTGLLTPIASVDREVLGAQVSLVVEARDPRGATGTATILVNIDDINDNCADFGQNGLQGYTFNSDQFDIAGGTIGTVPLNDPDSGVNGMVTVNAQTVGDYSLLANGGIIINVDGDTITYGETTRFVVVATDQGNPVQTCSTKVDIVHIEVATTTTTIITTTRAYNPFDDPANIAIVCLIALALAGLTGLGLYFCFRYCCPRGGGCSGICREQCRCGDDCCGERPMRSPPPSPPPTPPEKPLVVRPIQVIQPVHQPRFIPAVHYRQPPLMPPPGPMISSLPPSAYNGSMSPFVLSPPGTPTMDEDDDDFDDDFDDDNNSYYNGPVSNNTRPPASRPSRQ